MLFFGGSKTKEQHNRPDYLQLTNFSPVQLHACMHPCRHGLQVTAFGLRKLSGPSKFEQPTKMNTPTQFFFQKTSSKRAGSSCSSPRISELSWCINEIGPKTSHLQYFLRKTGKNLSTTAQTTNPEHRTHSGNLQMTEYAVRHHCRACHRSDQQLQLPEADSSQIHQNTATYT